MGKVKSAAMDGQEFAQDNFNLPRERFIEKAAEEFGKGSIAYYAALEGWYEIQTDMVDYFNSLEQGHPEHG